MKGKNIYLRILEEKDIPKTTKWINNEEISEIMGYLPTKSLFSQEQWFKEITQKNDRFIFAIIDIISDEHIGNVGIGNIDYISRNGMFNIFIADQKNRAKGVGTEVTNLILDFAFNKLNLHKVYLRTSERFIGANKMYKKIGFIKEGVMRDHYFSNGIYEDKIMYSILRNEFNKNEK